MQADCRSHVTNAEAIPAENGFGPIINRSGLKKIWRQLGQGLLLAALAFASYFLISHFLVQSVRVVGASMDPTLHDSERYLLNRWIYHVRDPQPNDVIVLRDPQDGCFAVKRVVAVAGDSVVLKGGRVYVNGRLLNEPYLVPGTQTEATSRSGDQVFQCGKDQYFVLGDNRRYSVDSRTYGPVPASHILGLVVR